MSVRTRHASACSLADFLGPGKELLPSELPTLRSALQLALYLQDIRMRREDLDKRNYPVAKLMRDVAQGVMTQYEKANSMFTQPVVINQKSLERKLTKQWERTGQASRGRMNKKDKGELEDKLDRLLDILRSHTAGYSVVQYSAL
jgi:hypothetical protein